ncbi:hypothetical protein R5R35_013478 [Gryllus longicercus]|uniref:Accessory gland protein n=1 Tax=Gryllus longicercus TaxID=2509291 RepID=A0AAN9V353_9ORTH
MRLVHGPRAFVAVLLLLLPAAKATTERLPFPNTETRGEVQTNCTANLTTADGYKDGYFNSSDVIAPELVSTNGNAYSVLNAPSSPTATTSSTRSGSELGNASTVDGKKKAVKEPELDCARGEGGACPPPVVACADAPTRPLSALAAMVYSWLARRGLRW